MKNSIILITSVVSVMAITGCATTVDSTPPYAPVPTYVPASVIPATNVQNISTANSAVNAESTSSPVYVPARTYKTTTDGLPVKHSTYTGSAG